MKTKAERAVSKYADTVRRICFIYLKNYSDVEDVFQEVFLKYILYTGSFESDDHERAWFIRVAINSCRDLLKSFFRRKVCSLEDADTRVFYIPEEGKDVLDALLKLPDKYKNVIYLFYYEGYTAVEIAKMLGRRENTIYTWLSRAKDKLRDILGGDFFDR